MSKFGKVLGKKNVDLGSKTIHPGFTKNILWSSSGSMALNLLLTGNPRKGFCFSKSCIIGGESGSGKSLVLATAARQAQKEVNAFVVWLDAEKASEQKWFERTGMDLSEDNFLRERVATIADVAGIWSNIIDVYDTEMKDFKAGKGDRPRPVFVVIDSFSVLMTDTQFGHAESGEVVGDQGQQAKQLKDLMKKITHLCDNREISVNGVVHTMQEQSSNPMKKVKTEIMLGGRGLMYLASMAFVFSKYSLTEENLSDDDDVGAKKVIGIRAGAKLYKSRFSKPNERVDLSIPWDTGISPTAGVFAKLFAEGVIVMPTKGWYSLAPNQLDNTGKPVTFTGIPDKFRKADFEKFCENVLNTLYPADELDIVEFDDKDRAEAEAA